MYYLRFPLVCDMPIFPCPADELLPALVVCPRFLVGVDCDANILFPVDENREDSVFHGDFACLVAVHSRRPWDCALGDQERTAGVTIAMDVPLENLDLLLVAFISRMQLLPQKRTTRLLDRSVRESSSRGPGTRWPFPFRPWPAATRKFPHSFVIKPYAWHNIPFFRK